MARACSAARNASKWHPLRPRQRALVHHAAVLLDAHLTREVHADLGRYNIPTDLQPQGLRVAGMIKETVWDRGWTARGSEDEQVAAARAHGRDGHGLLPTREQVPAVAMPVQDEDTDVEE
jgi:hypothetical protein